MRETAAPGCPAPWSRADAQRHRHPCAGEILTPRHPILPAAPSTVLPQHTNGIHSQIRTVSSACVDLMWSTCAAMSGAPLRLSRREGAGAHDRRLQDGCDLWGGHPAPGGAQQQLRTEPETGPARLPIGIFLADQERGRHLSKRCAPPRGPSPVPCGPPCAVLPVQRLDVPGNWASGAREPRPIDPRLLHRAGVLSLWRVNRC